MITLLLVNLFLITGMSDNIDAKITKRLESVMVLFLKTSIMGFGFHSRIWRNELNLA